jgi:hypothetical protein
VCGTAWSFLGRRRGRIGGGDTGPRRRATRQAAREQQPAVGGDAGLRAGPCVAARGATGTAPTRAAPGRQRGDAPLADVAAGQQRQREQQRRHEAERDLGVDHERGAEHDAHRDRRGEDAPGAKDHAGRLDLQVDPGRHGPSPRHGGLP